MAWGFGRKPVGSWRDRPCWRCGYPLRSLPGGDVRNCPECGLAVRISLNQNLSLAMANPEWLAWQTAACVIAAAAVLGAGAAVLVAVLFERLIASSIAVPMMIGFTSFTTVAEITGWWLLASRAPHQPQPEHRRWAIVARVTIVFLIAASAAAGIYSVVYRQAVVLFVVSIIVWPPLSCLIGMRMASYTAELMRRSQHRRLRSVFGFLTVVFMIGIFSPILFGIAFAQLSPTMSADTARWIIGGIATVMTIACSLAWLAAARQVWVDRRAAIAAWVSD